MKKLKEDAFLVYVPIPKPSFLSEECECIGVFDGEKRWKSMDKKRIFTWDGLHGEIEVFNNRGRHLGVLEPQNGMLIKPAIKGRKIDV
ncbi:MAG: colicin E3/pyocin S6 family cytotoxin [Pseudomonadota bacterium]